MVKELYLQAMPQMSYLLYLLGIGLLGLGAFVWVMWIEKHDQAKFDHEAD